jgi:prepilin-type processing-associated H-X9-DG protein
MDSRMVDGSGMYGYYRVDYQSQIGSTTVGNPDGTRHGGKINIAFGDGHVKGVTVDPANPHLTLGTGYRLLQWNGWANL